MPRDKPKSVKLNEVCALTALLLNLNGIVGAKATIAAHGLEKALTQSRRPLTKGIQIVAPLLKSHVRAAICDS